MLLFTATYHADRDRFLLLRRSLRAVGCEWRHVVAVHSEDDLESFRVDPFVVVLPTSEFLTPEIERRRVAAHHGRLKRQRWVTGGPLAGWYAQQLVKLAAVNIVSDDVLIHLDSDLVALKPLTADMFQQDGRTKHFVTADDRGDGSDAWNATAAGFLGVPLRQAQYIHWPTVWDVSTARAMLASVGDDWQERFAAANVFEFPAYGVWAAARPERLVEAEPLPVVNFALWEQMFSFADDARAAREGDAVFAGVQSRLHIPPSTYEDMLVG